GADSDADGQLKNDDALRLMQAASVRLDYAQVNPVVFAEPIAPHIAAERAGRRVTVDRLAGFVRGALMTPADLRLVEGAGGWLVPVNEHEGLNQLAQQLQLPVILVVGLKLGCLNHALLTARAIAADGLSLAGWVASQVDPAMAMVDDNLASLQRLLPAPCLGFIPYRAGIRAADAAACLQLPD
ncbi:MAG TPA: dethiobiotin synthase, partial [Pseudomonadales bacterium]